MEVYESIAWIAIGFIPTLLAMEVASRALSSLRSQKRKEDPVEVMTAGSLEK
jgi:hypothetical protein